MIKKKMITINKKIEIQSYKLQKNARNLWHNLKINIILFPQNCYLATLDKCNKKAIPFLRGRPRGFFLVSETFWVPSVATVLLALRFRNMIVQRFESYCD